MISIDPIEFESIKSSVLIVRIAGHHLINDNMNLTLTSAVIITGQNRRSDDH